MGGEWYVLSLRGVGSSVCEIDDAFVVAAWTATTTV